MAEQGGVARVVGIMEAVRMRGHAEVVTIFGDIMSGAQAIAVMTSTGHGGDEHDTDVVTLAVNARLEWWHAAIKGNAQGSVGD